MDHKLLAQQLRKPNGELAAIVAESMNENNRIMTLHSIEILGIQNGDSILEIGPGNGKFAEVVVQKADQVSYYGVDYSPDMVKIASNLNVHLLETGQVRFMEGSAEALPLEDQTADKIFTVNTVYFMEDPEFCFREMFRVLKPGGICCITFASKSSMESLPFVRFGFRLYETEEIAALITNADFQVEKIISQKEAPRQVEEVTVQREINFVIAKKPKGLLI